MAKRRYVRQELSQRSLVKRRYVRQKQPYPIAQAQREHIRE